jgi:hypothetical protein
MDSFTKSKVDELLSFKQEKLTKLKKSKEDVESKYNKFKQSKVTSSISTGYLLIKRFLLLIIGILLLMLGVLLFAVPEITLADESFKEEVLESYKEEFTAQVGVGLLESIYILSNEYSESGANDLIEALELSIDKLIEKEISETIRLFSIIIVLSALIILYISRLSKKMKVKYTQLKNADSLAQTAVNELTEIIDSQQKELDLMKQLFTDSNS